MRIGDCGACRIWALWGDRWVDVDLDVDVIFRLACSRYFLSAFGSVAGWRGDWWAGCRVE